MGHRLRITKISLDDLPENANLDKIEPLETENGEIKSLLLEEPLIHQPTDCEVESPSDGNTNKEVVSIKVNIARWWNNYKRKKSSRKKTGLAKFIRPQRWVKLKFSIGWLKCLICAVTLAVIIIVIWWNLKLQQQPVIVVAQVSFKSQVDYAIGVPSQALHLIQSELSFETVGEATGSSLVPDKTASGPVRFLNAGPGSLTLLVGTLIATTPNGVEYRLNQSVMIAGTDIGAERPGFATAMVQASRPGTIGNLPAGIGNFTLSSNLRVAGVGAVTGGTDKTVRFVTDEDVARTKDQTMNKFTQSAAVSALKTKMQSGWILLSDNHNQVGEATGLINAQTQHGFFETLIQEIVVKRAEDGSSLKVSLKVSIRGTAINPVEILTSLPAKVGIGQGQPIFKGVSNNSGTVASNSSDNMSSVEVLYDRPVDAKVMLSHLQDWHGTLKQLDELVTDMTKWQEIQDLNLPTLPESMNPDKRIVLVIEEVMR